ncbi:MAG: hypothetical protein KQA33_02800 [Candidatus Aenigmarchaeota archaeon]|nr:hypothetical protein [Candidatus Aenigmarchaeota archaeon]
MKILINGALWAVLIFILFSACTAAITEPTSTIIVPIEAIRTQSEPVSHIEPIVIPFQNATKVESIPIGCKNLCGDGVCQEIVCLAEGCPCPETSKSCPQDCSQVSPVPPKAPVIALPTQTSIKVVPTETTPIFVDNRPVEFEGIEVTPAISTQVKSVSAQAPVTVKVNVDKQRGSTEIEVEGTVAVTKEILKFENVSLKVETPKGDVAVQVLPNAAIATTISKESQKIENVELKVFNGEPVYKIEGKRDTKLLWIFPVTVPITTHVNAVTGGIEKTEKPWWSFLAQ